MVENLSSRGNASIQASFSLALTTPCHHLGQLLQFQPGGAYTENDANNVSQGQLRHDGVLVRTLETKKCTKGEKRGITVVSNERKQSTLANPQVKPFQKNISSTTKIKNLTLKQMCSFKSMISRNKRNTFQCVHQSILKNFTSEIMNICSLKDILGIYKCIIFLFSTKLPDYYKY